mgnify:CR=1 FL=1
MLFCICISNFYPILVKDDDGKESIIFENRSQVIDRLIESSQYDKFRTKGYVKTDDGNIIFSHGATYIDYMQDNDNDLKQACEKLKIDNTVIGEVRLTRKLNNKTL